MRRPAAGPDAVDGPGVDSPPERVSELARRRALARSDRDFAAADALRAQIGQLGWQVADTSDGYSLQPLPAYQVLPGPTALPRPAGDRPATVALLVQGWPDDLRECVMALLDHAPAEVMVSCLDLGNADGAGDALHELAAAYPDRIEEWHVPAGSGWGEARTAMLAADPAGIHVIMDTSTILTGDALGPLLAAVREDGVAAAGWRGADPDPDRRSFHDAGPGRVTALLGYLLAVRKQAALQAGGLPAQAQFYRNADLEFSLRLGAHGALVVPAGPLPVRQARHRGYHDSDPAYRERESRRNYSRVLKLLRAADPARDPGPGTGTG